MKNKPLVMKYAGVNIILFLFFSVYVVYGQDSEPLTRTIRGVVTDQTSGETLANITVELAETQMGTSTEEDGTFELNRVPIGRYTISLSGVGYERVILKEVLVTSSREVYLDLELVSTNTMLDEVVVGPRVNKDESLNRMALLGAQMFSVEEASRFAGGMDDPARLVSNYAGVATPSTSNNGISIRGNAPSLLQWRLEGVEIPNPNHFADIDVLGGGFLSALSGNVLGNSDFFIGAFPAEYHNAISGVFDMKLRNGSSRDYHHAFQLGILGIDLASEGPISREQGSSYLLNYRYSTTGLLEKIRGKEGMGGTLGYQDLNFKFNFPTRKAGTFSVWGMGLIDEVVPILDDESERVYLDEGVLSSAKQRSGAMGVSHRYYFGNQKTSIRTRLAATHLGSHIHEEFYDLDNRQSPKTDLTTNSTNLVLTSALTHEFGPNHTNQTGVTLTNIHYDMDLDWTPLFGQPLENLIRSRGSTNLLSAYTQSLLQLGSAFSLTAGLNMQYLTLNGGLSVEPRASIKWQVAPRHSLALGYGLHSRMEKADVYFVRDGEGKLPNQSIDFTKSHHLMLSYNHKLSDNMGIKVEPYFQWMTDIPVSETGAYSILNRKEFYMSRALVGEGRGVNYGVDATFSRYLKNGMYYMLTGSLFQSKYQTAGGEWFDTRYNRQFIVNGLIGKEWLLGRNMLSINLKASTLGGQRYTPVDYQATMAHPDKEVQYVETQMFSQQFSPMFVGDFSISYGLNRERVSHTFALKSVNATRQKEYVKHQYNTLTGVIEPSYSTNSLFNLSYRIDF